MPTFSIAQSCVIPIPDWYGVVTSFASIRKGYFYFIFFCLSWMEGEGGKDKREQGTLPLLVWAYFLVNKSLGLNSVSLSP